MRSFKSFTGTWKSSDFIKFQRTSQFPFFLRIAQRSPCFFKISQYILRFFYFLMDLALLELYPTWPWIEPDLALELDQAWPLNSSFHRNWKIFCKHKATIYRSCRLGLFRECIQIGHAASNASLTFERSVISLRKLILGQCRRQINLQFVSLRHNDCRPFY